MIAEQLAELVREGDQMGDGTKLRRRIERVVIVQGQILQAQGVQEQHRELGLPLGPAVRDEAEARDALRSAVMMVGVAAGEWVADLDFTRRRAELSRTNGSAKRKRTDEETI